MDKGIKEDELLLTSLGAWPIETNHAQTYHTIVSLDADPAHRFQSDYAKRILDITGSSVLIALLFPVFAFIAILLFFTGKNVFFEQKRIGRSGFLFKCYKFRTMVINADHQLDELLAHNPIMRDEWERTQKLSIDPRITRLGRFLRKTSLDELPQLFNVLRGDMSLVGPRPIVLDEIRRYGRGARWYLSVRPGMTGLWQVSRNADTGYNRRVAMDIYYVRNQSVVLDMLILLRTVRAAIQKDGTGC